LPSRLSISVAFRIFNSNVMILTPAYLKMCCLTFLRSNLNCGIET